MFMNISNPQPHSCTPLPRRIVNLGFEKHANVPHDMYRALEKRVRVVKIRDPELVQLAPHLPAHDALIILFTTRCQAIQ